MDDSGQPSNDKPAAGHPFGATYGDEFVLRLLEMVQDLAYKKHGCVICNRITLYKSLASAKWRCDFTLIARKQMGSQDDLNRRIRLALAK